MNLTVDSTCFRSLYRYQILAAPLEVITTDYPMRQLRLYSVKNRKDQEDSAVLIYKRFPQNK